MSERPESSWIGGEPHLPADAVWLDGVHGAMTFVAQLSLADLDPSGWTGPTSGHLHVFCDIEPESLSIEGAGACAILHTPAGAELSVRHFASDIHVPQQFVRPRIGLTLPDEDAPLNGVHSVSGSTAHAHRTPRNCGSSTSACMASRAGTIVPASCSGGRRGRTTTTSSTSPHSGAGRDSSGRCCCRPTPSTRSYTSCSRQPTWPPPASTAPKQPSNTTELLIGASGA